MQFGILTVNFSKSTSLANHAFDALKTSMQVLSWKVRLKLHLANFSLIWLQNEEKELGWAVSPFILFIVKSLYLKIQLNLLNEFAFPAHSVFTPTSRTSLPH